MPTASSNSLPQSLSISDSGNGSTAFYHQSPSFEKISLSGGGSSVGSSSAGTGTLAGSYTVHPTAAVLSHHYPNYPVVYEDYKDTNEGLTSINNTYGNLYLTMYDDYGSMLLQQPGRIDGSGVGDVDCVVPRVRTVKKRVNSNRKERRRTHSINAAFAALRGCIPNVPSDTKLSKIKTLRLATSYIAYLMEVLNKDDPNLTEEGFKADMVTRKIENRDEKRKRESQVYRRVIQFLLLTLNFVVYRQYCVGDDEYTRDDR
jgi:hypothetical protein